MKKKIVLLALSLLIGFSFYSCAKEETQKESNESKQESSQKTENKEQKSGTNFDKNEEIIVISREDGSGTRGAFVDLFGVKEKNKDGKKVDMTVSTADIFQSTGVVMSSVKSSKYAIAYVSLGSLNSDIKALKIDGVEASVEKIKSGDYKISRPFNIATKGEIAEHVQDFINFIKSDEGQKIVEETGYISKESSGAFESNGKLGKITITGSSSVTPVMEKLKEAYEKTVDGAEIELSQSDSTNGMNSVLDGICEIGMASRELKDSELEKGLDPIVIALDGIAVIVNNDNPLDDISKENVKLIYKGELLNWNELN